MKFIRLILAMMIVMIPISTMAAQVVFSGNTDGFFNLFRLDTLNGKVVRLTQNAADDLMPAISPDGSRIAFVSSRGGANSLYLMSNAPNTQPVDISARMGAYANPAFSPDGKKIAAQYAPDPEEFFKATKIVLHDPVTRKQETLIDSILLKTSSNTETTTVVDRPVWVSESLLAYVLAEFSDPELGRLTKSTIYLYDLKKQQHVRLAGGESYFDAEGRPVGFKASMPGVITSADRSRKIVFSAIRGATEREPMEFALTGGNKGIVKLNDPEFYGPLHAADNQWIYGTMNQQGITGLAWQNINSPGEKNSLQFEGRVLYPAVSR